MSILVNASSYTKCVSLSNHKCGIQPNENSQELHYYPFSIKLDRCDTLNDLSNKV